MNIKNLISEWRKMSPIEWAEHQYGWIGEDDRPIRLAAWQRAVLGSYWFWRAVVSTLFISTVKKGGKTFLDSLLTCYRWLTGPDNSVHFVIGNDKDQSSELQILMISAMVARHPLLKRYVKVNKGELVFTPTGSRLVSLSADFAGNAGANFSTVSITELWGFRYEAAQRLYEELTPIPGDCLRIIDSYAGFLSESLVLKQVWDRGLSGERISEDWPIYLSGGQLSYVHTGEDAQIRCWRGTDAEREAYYTEQHASLRPLTYNRLHLNEWQANESPFCDMADWDACLDIELRPAGPGMPLIFGCDASTVNDLTGLVGVGWNPEKKRTELGYVRYWDPKAIGRKLDPAATIGEELKSLKERGFKIVKALYDPWQMVSVGNALKAAGIETEEFPQTNRRVEADTALFHAIRNKTLVTFPEPELRKHIANAVGVEGVRGVRIAKERATQKVDLAVALSMANFGASEKLNLPAATVTISPNPFFGGSLDGQKVQNSAEFIKHPLYDNAGRFLGPHANPSTTFDTCWHFKHGPGCLPCSQAVMAYRAEQRRLAREEMAENDRVLTRKIFG